jgi:hypothetical protein
MLLWKKITIGIGALLLVLGGGALALFAFALSAMADNMCANTVLSEQPSPDGKLKAVVFERSCGATTGFSTQVSLIRADEKLENEGGGLFAADTNEGRAPAGLGGGPEVHFRWLSNSTAELRHHPQVRIFTAERKSRAIEVVYLMQPQKNH